MDTGELIEIAVGADRITEEQAKEISGLGISELLKHGLSYSEALLVLERAEIAIRRGIEKRISFGRP
jgi:hypothetical protein